jgi:uncharacterized membrane protein
MIQKSEYFAIFLEGESYSMAGQPLSQPSVSPSTRLRLLTVAGKIGGFILNYWLLIVTIFFGTVCLAALGTPILAYFNQDSLARPLFLALSRICGQIPSHSFYIEGHQVGLCVHCLAIYSSLFAGSLFFAVSKRRWRELPWWGMVLFALPLAYDGFSQMFGLRESTWQIRLVTGVLFGLGCVWFALPLIQKGLEETVAPSAP